MASAFGRRAAGVRLERMRASPRFRDGVFHNTAAVSPGIKQGYKLKLAREAIVTRHRTPPAPLPSDNPLATWAKRVETGLRVTWLGHSTVLLELDGARVLTDPVWGNRASPSQFAGPKRFQPVPVTLSQLPELDAVLISHDHYDHLDHPTIVELAKRTDVPFFTSLGVGAHLEAWGVPLERIHELDWWDSVQLKGKDVRITATPSQHFSGRGVADRNSTLWSSFVVAGPKHKVFFSGDTGLTEEYSDIARRFGGFDLAMLEIGAFNEAWGDIHLGPANALKAARLLGAPRLFPVHWGTFNLGIHAWDDPPETIIRLAPKMRQELYMPKLGAALELSRVAPEVEPWWRAVGQSAPEPVGETGDVAEVAVPAPID